MFKIYTNSHVYLVFKNRLHKYWHVKTRRKQEAGEEGKASDKKHTECTQEITALSLTIVHSLGKYSQLLNCVENKDTRIHFD